MSHSRREWSLAGASACVALASCQAISGVDNLELRHRADAAAGGIPTDDGSPGGAAPGSGGGGKTAGGGASSGGRSGATGSGGATAGEAGGGGTLGAGGDAGLRDAAPGDASSDASGAKDSAVTCVDGAPCPVSNPCHKGKTSCKVGGSDCTDDGNQLNGAPCNDGNACTQTDQCQGGVCTGSNPKTCGTNMTCAAGACVCATGTSTCPTGCVDEATDKANCGACSHGCQRGLCSASTCQSWVVQQLAGATSGIASDGTNVVWLDSASKKLLQVPVAGGTPITLATLGSAGGRLAMANGVIVVTLQNAAGQMDVWVATEGAANSGYVMTTIGSSTSIMASYGLAINATGGTAFAEVDDFTTGTGTIQTCVIGLANACTKLVSATPSDLGDDMIANASYLFWTVDANGSVSRYGFSAHNTVDVTTSQGGPYVLALDSTYVYWGNRGGNAFVVNRTSQTTPNPTSPEPVVPNTAGTLNALATDGKYLYYGGQSGTTKIGYVPVAGGTRTPLYASGTGAVTSLVFAGGALYFYDAGDKTIRGIAPPP